MAETDSKANDTGHDRLGCGQRDKEAGDKVRND